jgi:hypothetical protein
MHKYLSAVTALESHGIPMEEISSLEVYNHYNGNGDWTPCIRIFCNTAAWDMYSDWERELSDESSGDGWFLRTQWIANTTHAFFLRMFCYNPDVMS